MAQKKDDIQGAIAETQFTFEQFPMHIIRLVDCPVKALTATGGLTKGETYFISHVTSGGKVAVKGNTERLYPMQAFARATYRSTSNGTTEVETSSDKLP